VEGTEKNRTWLPELSCSEFKKAGTGWTELFMLCFLANPRCNGSVKFAKKELNRRTDIIRKGLGLFGKEMTFFQKC
jgi:hypothetical protein